MSGDLKNASFVLADTVTGILGVETESLLPKRGLTGQCFYHPTPLTTTTKRRPDSDNQIHVSTSPSLRNLGNPRSDSEVLDVIAERSPVANPVYQTKKLLLAGYLGPTSFISGLEEKVLHCLHDFSAIKNLVQKFYGVSQTVVIACSLILNALDGLEATFNESELGIAFDE
ncbi:hypothetical protein PENANT_c039G07129 [Penicillium antarcticum]|uniref:Uncharacterized protein n=1 Tax=Penicillium antarcticum TaxID=416450 RepID=A0A1V6PTM4_9EURO|nr:hypothetical protein PENANT_c039G07129 [Penicillium antarcticum]